MNRGADRRFFLGPALAAIFPCAAWLFAPPQAQAVTIVQEPASTQAAYAARKLAEFAPPDAQRLLGVVERQLFRFTRLA